ncbi:phosphoheptose isomerase [Humitalea rosea]|uniref:Phosphoheptose isomerase n=1 Tax=Humitalea rosea TaxID=990373 RepID=A0A2W7I2Q4_9PROT|nr:D-sedoheptulose 7-phosphate isomerase [Humitalea rosea]PZW40429.1 phosphoheptose isomerase [Humitalea rosea]
MKAAAELAASAAAMASLAADTAICASVDQAASLVVASLRDGGKLLLCGNGGSAADAQHWAAELVSRFQYDRPGLAAIALTTDSSIMTAIGNDYGYERLFARQIEALGRAGDVLFALSTSGNSPNILAALTTARGMGIGCVGFTGGSGGKMVGLCDIALVMPSTNTARIQEGHEAVGHAICGMIEHQIFPKNATPDVSLDRDLPGGGV